MACLLWAPPASAQQLLDRVVARVNGVAITLTDVNAAIGLGLVEQQAGGEQAGATLQLIDRQLMLAEVARFAPPEPDPALVEREAAALRAHAGAGLAALMQGTGLDDQRVRDLARDSLRIQSYLAQRFGTTVQVSDEDVEQYYRANPQEFTRNGVLMPLEEAAPAARTRVAARRRAEIIAQWVRDLRMRAEISTAQPGAAP